MNENLTVNANLIPFQIVASDEICRINADGTTTYHWDRIEAAAQRWEPGCVDIAVCLSKLLLPLRGRSEWRSLSEEDISRIEDQCWSHGGLGAAFLRVDFARAVEAKLKEKNA